MRNKYKGFSTAEMLIVIAILAILLAVSAVAVARYRKPMKRLEMDETAKEIFLSAQERMGGARTQRIFDQVAFGSDDLVATLLTAPTRTDAEIAAAEAAEAAYYGTNLAGSVWLADGSNEALLQELLPDGSVEGHARQMQYVVRYDRETYDILDVYYTDEAKFDLSAYIKNYMGDHGGVNATGFAALRTALESENARMEVSNGSATATIGWYGEEPKAAPSADPNAVTLTVDLNGGSYGGHTVYTSIRLSDDEIREPHTSILECIAKILGTYDTGRFVKPYCEFGGWKLYVNGEAKDAAIDSSVFGLLDAVRPAGIVAQAQWKKASCKVTFVDSDGTTIGTPTLYDYGTSARTIESDSPDAATMAAKATEKNTAQYTYEFDSWIPAFRDVKSDQTYRATYRRTTNTYTITWKNDDGSTIDTTTVEYGSTPAHDPATKAADAQYTYTFAGWTPEIATVTGNAEYTATYTPVTRSYTITWKNDDGSTIDTTTVEYGSTPAHDPATKAADAQYTYTFAGWSPEIATVTGNAEYTATYTPVTRSYTITWLDGDGKALKKDEVAYGDMPLPPSYSGAGPTKAASDDGRITYEFNGAWSPTIVAVTSDATYTAQFDTKYKVTFHANGGKFGSGDSASDTSDMFVKHGEKVTAPPPDPTRDGYDFKGWYPTKDSDTQYVFDTTTVTGPVDLYAKWELATLRIYFELGGGTITSDGIVYNKVDDIKVRKDNENTLDSFLPVGEPTHSAYTLKDPASPWKFHQGAKNGALIDGSTPVKDVPDTVTDIWAVVQWAKPVQKVTVKVMRQNTTQTGNNEDHSVTITSEQLADAGLGIGTPLDSSNVQTILNLATPSLNSTVTMTGSDGYSVPKYSHFTYTNLTGDSGTLTDLDAGDAEICLYYTRDTITFHFYNWNGGTTNMVAGTTADSWILIRDQSLGDRFDYIDRVFTQSTRWSDGEKYMMHFKDLKWDSINLRTDIQWTTEKWDKKVYSGKPTNTNSDTGSQFIIFSIQGAALKTLLGKDSFHHYSNTSVQMTSQVTINESHTYVIRIQVASMKAALGKGFTLVRTGTSKKWGFHLFDISSGNLEAKWTEYKTIEGLYGATFADAGYTSWDAVTDGKGYAGQDGYPVELTGFFDADVIDENDSNEFSFYHFTGQVN